MRLATIVAAIGLALAIPASALASDAAYEPNNGIQEAYGPLLADTDYDGETSSSNDADWYILYVSGPGELHVKLTNLADSPAEGSVQFRLLDGNGERLNSDGASDNEASEIVYTTPAAGTYYVRVTSDYASNRYRLRLTGPLTGGPRPGPAEVTPNNNPDIGSAFGPLLGGHSYAGSIDAYYEEDWFYFYTAGPGTFDLALMNSGDDSEGSISVYLRDKDGERISSAEAYNNTIDHIVYTAAGAEKFVIEVDGDYVEDHYQLRIDPASLLTTIAPPAVAPAPAPVTAACKKARAKRKGVFAGFKKAQRKRGKAARKLKKAHRAKARRHWRKSKRHWAKATKKRRKALTKANNSMKSLCA